jgi:hypothetical protein
MKHYRIPVIIIALAVAFTVHAADWHLFAGDAANSGSSPDMVPRDLSAAEIVSSGTIGIKGSSSPVVADGNVYVYCAAPSNGCIRCLDGQTLTSLWSAPVPIADFGWGSWGSPAVVNSSIVYAADAFLGCWNLDGSVRWTITMSHQTVNSSPLVIEDRIYVGAFSYLNAEGGVGCYDLNSGSQLWFNAVINNSTFSSCTPVSSSDSVTSGVGYACCSNQLWQFDLESGTTIWQRTLPGNGLNNVSIARPATVLAVNYDYMYAPTNLYAYDTNGNFLWCGKTGMSDMPPAVYQDGSTAVCIHAAGDSGVPAELTAFNSATGEELWRYTGAGNNANMPVISKGVVYAASGLYSGWVFNGLTNLTAFNVLDGTVLSSSGTTQGGMSPAIAGDVLYTANNGTLYAYTWPVTPLTVEKLNAKIMMVKINRDSCKLIASIDSADIPLAWLNTETELDLLVGGINFFRKDDDRYSIKTDTAAKLSFSYKSTDKTAKVRMKWTAKKGVVQIKAGIKKDMLQSMLPGLPAGDGTRQETMSVELRAQDHLLDAGSQISVPVKRKKDTVSVKYKQ